MWLLYSQVARISRNPIWVTFQTEQGGCLALLWSVLRGDARQSFLVWWAMKQSSPQEGGEEGASGAHWKAGESTELKPARFPQPEESSCAQNIDQHTLLPLGLQAQETETILSGSMVLPEPFSASWPRSSPAASCLCLPAGSVTTSISRTGILCMEMSWLLYFG